MSETNNNTRLVFNVGGQRHEVFLSTLKAIPATRLSWIAENFSLLKHSPAYDPVREEFYFDRSPTAFIPILNYFRTGELHYPNNVCGPSFATELRFWGLDEEQMQSCCWEGYTTNRDKDAKLRGFKGPHFEMDSLGADEDNFELHGKHFEIRYKMWKFFDDAYSSKAAKIYSFIGHILLLIYIILPIIKSMDFIKKPKNQRTRNAAIFIHISEIVLNIFFTVELIIRFTLFPNKKRFVRSRLNIADFMSVIPIFIDIVFCDYPAYKSYKNYVNILVVFRIVKVFRSFRYNYTLQVLFNTLKSSLPELSLLVFLMILLATVFAFGCYFTEQEDPNTEFHSVPHSLWWAFITMTTVGYGDMYPNSWLGRILGIMAAICGLLMVALPVSVVATNFSIYYSYAKARISLPPKKKVRYAKDANNFLGQSPSNDEKERLRRNKIQPGTPCVTPVKMSPLNARKNRAHTLPPLNDERFSKVHRVVEKMKEKGLLSTKKKKMDLPTLVMVLSSKGDWTQPK